MVPRRPRKVGDCYLQKVIYLLERNMITMMISATILSTWVGVDPLTKVLTGSKNVLTYIKREHISFPSKPHAKSYQNTYICQCTLTLHTTP